MSTPTLPPLQAERFDVAGWARDEEYEIFPIGSRPKELIIAPAVVPSAVLRPGHHYLFKESARNYPTQYWAEIIAYRIGLVCGVEVPPAFAAFDSTTGQDGALIEWFYDMRAGVPRTRFTPGSDYLEKLIPGFDTKTGRQHNLKSVLLILAAAQRRGLPDPIVHWARIFAFDALIGNTDRHQENWGLMYPPTGVTSPVAFAPAFDNGTSLGHERTEAALPRFDEPAYLSRYVQKGRHHMRWALGEERVGHFELLEKVISAYPQTRQAVSLVASCSADDIAQEIGRVAGLGLEHGFTEARSRFVLALTLHRHHLLGAI